MRHCCPIDRAGVLTNTPSASTGWGTGLGCLQAKPDTPARSRTKRSGNEKCAGKVRQHYVSFRIPLSPERTPLNGCMEWCSCFKPASKRRTAVAHRSRLQVNVTLFKVDSDITFPGSRLWRIRGVFSIRAYGPIPQTVFAYLFTRSEQALDCG